MQALAGAIGLLLLHGVDCLSQESGDVLWVVALCDNWKAPDPARTLGPVALGDKRIGSQDVYVGKNEAAKSTLVLWCYQFSYLFFKLTWLL